MKPSSAPITPNGGGPVKPPPSLTHRDMNNKVVNNLFVYKAHLEYLHREAFVG